MAAAEMPTISGSRYASTAVNLSSDLFSLTGGSGAAVDSGFATADCAIPEVRLHRMIQVQQPNVTHQEKHAMANPARRLVQVFIADPNENVPLDTALLYSGKQQFTDATDQELFFEIDINTILKAYNEKRIKIVDRKVKERTEFLEAAKIRDLKMVVVTIAGF